MDALAKKLAGEPEILSGSIHVEIPGTRVQVKLIEDTMGTPVEKDKLKSFIDICVDGGVPMRYTFQELLRKLELIR
jgi:hypothetical protein